jgi:hypothetical protein
MKSKRKWKKINTTRSRRGGRRKIGRRMKRRQKNV